MSRCSRAWIVLLAAATVAASAQAQELRLGLVVPVTGGAADVGKREAIGANVAVDEINAAGGVNGRPLRLFFADEGASPQEAISAVRKVAGDDKVLAIVGPHYSSTAEATFPLGNRLKIVQVAVASSKPGVSAANRPYAFRNTLTEDKIAASVVRQFKERYGVKRVAIITDIKDAVAKSLGTAVLPAALKEAGIKIVNEGDPVTFQTGDAQFAAQITRLKALGADGVALGALGPDAVNIVTEARRQGMTQPFMGTAPLMEGNMPEKTGAAGDGTLSGTIWDASLDDPRSRRFVEAYRAKARTLYPGPYTAEPDYYAANAYDAVYMLGAAIRSRNITGDPSSLEADRVKIMEAFSAMKSFDGIASNGFNDVGDGVKTVRVFVIKGGSWTPLAD